MNNLFFYIKTIALGLIFGFLYGLVFVGKFKSFYKKHSKGVKNINIFSIIFFSALSHLLLVGVFIFLLFKLKVNIPIVVICFMISFWCSVVRGTRI